MRRNSLPFVVVVVALFVGPAARSEIVQIHPRADHAAAIEHAVASHGRIIHRNPHDGSFLLEVPEAASLAIPTGEAAVFRHVEEFPVSHPGAIRLMTEVEAGSEGVLDKRDIAANLAEAVGGHEVWRSRFTRSVQFDIPFERVGDFVEAAPLDGYWFDTRGKPSLAQSVPLVGVTGNFGPYYWPSSWDFHFIAVLDTGVISGGALAGRVDHGLGACFSRNKTSLVSNYYSACPNSAIEAYGPTAALPCSVPGCLHGSWVSAIATSAVYPNLGIIASSNVRILPIKIATLYDPNTPGNPNDDEIYYYEADVQRALDYVIQAGLLGFKVGAVNMSFISRVRRTAGRVQVISTPCSPCWTTSRWV